MILIDPYKPRGSLMVRSYDKTVNTRLKLTSAKVEVEVEAELGNTKY